MKALSGSVLLFTALCVAVFGGVWAGLAMGPLELPLGVVLAAVAGGGDSEAAGFVVREIRGPRVAGALVVGGALGLAGLGLQGLTRNGLADTGVLGVAAGAALGAVAALAAGGAAVAPVVLNGSAFAGALGAMVVAVVLARAPGGMRVARLLLAGIGISALAGAGTGWLLLRLEDAELRSFTFWSLGSLGGATWPRLAAAVPWLAAGVAALAWAVRSLDAWQLGETEARQLGLPVERVKMAVVAGSSAITAAAVALCGIVGFVGLVVPHLARLMLGPGHRRLAVASVLGGAALVAWADALARVAVAPQEVPLGVVTATVGAPVLCVLLTRLPREAGG